VTNARLRKLQSGWPMAFEQAGYPPKCFIEQDRERLVAFMRATGLASLVTFADEHFYTTALPLLVDWRDDAVVLSGHMPRTNPQSAMLSAHRGLAIFQGPQAYVRSNWYPTKQRDPRTTPTWDYISVRAEGTLETFEGQAELHDHLRQLSDHFESAFPDPWAITDAPERFIATMASSLVGFTMRIERMSGIWKLHQNHPLENRQGVIAGLRSTKDAGAIGIAAAIEHDLSRRMTVVK
jgi:transcriptional regulator